ESGADLALELGTLSSLGTAITGAAQWYDLQNDEEPRRLGALHAALNSTALGFYIASIALRRKDHRAAGIMTAWTGHALVTASGYVGGHLSFGLGAGVDREAFDYPPTKWTDTIADTDLPDGKLTRVDLDDASIMLLKQAGTVYATSAVCTHVGAPLNKGDLDGYCVTCPWHYSVFDVRDGKAIHGPATASLAAYDTRITDGTVQVRLRQA
ncbi:MAG TPA: non-heme iron oxygenase ferredoxin subunit, partial [Thermomicrobiales bacterium]|nr:non-heme iron oxygenase ferredoxin subunit [Thermomicrobiales bacterium]